jgi:hypothetical protein
MIKKYLHLALLAFVGFNSPAIAQLPKDSIQLILNTEIKNKAQCRHCCGLHQH